MANSKEERFKIHFLNVSNDYTDILLNNTFTKEELKNLEREGVCAVSSSIDTSTKLIKVGDMSQWTPIKFNFNENTLLPMMSQPLEPLKNQVPKQSALLFPFRLFKHTRPKQQRWLLQFRGHIYILEGNIGSGKSTLGTISDLFYFE